MPTPLKSDSSLDFFVLPKMFDDSHIVNYSDYRSFLKDLYLFRKTQNGRYSYRQFSLDLGLQHSNYLHLVVQGKRNLSLDAVRKIESSLKWTANQKKFFSNLVLFNQSQDAEERETHRQTLMKLLGKKRVVLHQDQFLYFSTWYIPVLREIIALKGFVSNLSWISKKLKPHVDESLVRDGLSILERLGMIQKVKGKWTQTQEHFTTGTEVTSDMLFHYHKEMLKLSVQSLKLKAKERDVSAMTMTLSQEQFQWLKNKIDEFRDEIQQELQDKKDNPVMVGQLNIQFFPVTEI